MKSITAYGAAASGTLVVALLMAGGLAQAQPSASLRITEVSEASHPYRTWHCAQQAIDVRMVGRSLEVRVDGESRLLQQAISASGARYVMPGDSGTEFWGKGGQASLSWSGRVLPLCAEAGALLIPLRASGNEPFWAVDYDGWRLTLKQPAQPERQFDVERAAPGTGHWTLQTTGKGQPVRLDIRQAVCVDNMSGMPRPYTVSLNMNEQHLQGCGGDPERLLQGVRWQLKAVGDQAVNVPAWLEFLPEQRLAGFNGCNRLMGRYTLSGESLQFSQLGSTRMACPPEIMAQAGEIDRLLAGVQGFSIDAQGGLSLIAAQGVLLWQRARPD